MNFNTYIILYIYTLIMVYYLTTIVTAAASYLTQPLTHCHNTHFNAMISVYIYSGVIYVLKFM